MKTTDQITALQIQKTNLEAIVASLSRKIKAGSEGDYARALAERSVELQSVNDALVKLAENTTA